MSSGREDEAIHIGKGKKKWHKCRYVIGYRCNSNKYIEYSR
jgi:hypothetical protein